MLSKKSDDIPIASFGDKSAWRLASLRANWRIALALLLLWPLSWLVQDSGYVDNYAKRIIMLIGVNVMLAVSLQLINGISGQFSLGHAGFMAIGAYTAGYILKHAPASSAAPEAIYHGSLLLGALVLAGLVAAVSGLIVGMPTLRLRGDYLAIATLGFGEIIRVLITNTPALGAATGMGGIPPYTTFGWLYGAVIVTVVCVWRIARSAKGLNLAAVREDEIAASAVGIDTTYHKVLAFIVGAFFAGVAGGLFASLSTYINPVEFGFLRSVEVVVIVTLGGLGSISGAIVTAAVLTLLPEVLRGFTDWRMVIYSLLLVGMMLLRPQGLLGNRELWPPIAVWRRFFGNNAQPGFAVTEPGASPTVERKAE